MYDLIKKYVILLVALVVAGIILTIAGIIVEGSGKHLPNSEPFELMKTELKSIESAGFGVSQPKQVEFTNGMQVSRKAVIGYSPILEAELEFACGSQSSALCGSSYSPLNVTSDNIIVNNNSKGWIVFCGDDSLNKSVKYYVCIGSRPDDARNACLSKCQMTLDEPVRQ